MAPLLRLALCKPDIAESSRPSADAEPGFEPHSDGWPRNKKMIRRILPMTGSKDSKENNDYE